VRSGGEGGCPIRHAATTSQRRLTLSRRGSSFWPLSAALLDPCIGFQTSPPGCRRRERERAPRRLDSNEKRGKPLVSGSDAEKPCFDARSARPPCRSLSPQKARQAPSRPSLTSLPDHEEPRRAANDLSHRSLPFLSFSLSLCPPYLHLLRLPPQRRVRHRQKCFQLRPHDHERAASGRGGRGRGVRGVSSGERARRPPTPRPRGGRLALLPLLLPSSSRGRRGRGGGGGGGWRAAPEDREEAREHRGSSLFFCFFVLFFRRGFFSFFAFVRGG